MSSKLLNKLTLVQLEYIVSVDNFRHFASAAESCFVTQPTLSMQIQKLEDQLGVIIFDRSKHPVVPTEIGKLVIDQARVVLNESKKIVELIEDEESNFSGELRIGVIPTIAPYLLPLFLSEFTDKYPNISLKVEEIVTDQIVNKLKKDKLDVGILVTPLEDSNFHEIPLFYEQFIAYLSENSRLNHKSKLAADDLEDSDLWILNEDHCFRTQVMNLCAIAMNGNGNGNGHHNGNVHSNGNGHSKINSNGNGKAKRKIDYESGSLESIKKMVDRFGGLTLLPELATLDLNNGLRERLRGFQEPIPFREVSLVTHRSFLKKKLINTLQEEIIAAIPENISRTKEGEIVNWR